MKQQNKVKRGFKSVNGIGTVTVMRQDSPMVAPGKAVPGNPTYSTHGNPAHYGKIQHIALLYRFCINTVERLAGLS